MDVRRELMDLAMKFQNAAEHAKSHQLDAEEKEEAGELMEGYGEFWKGTSFAYKNAKSNLRDLICKLERYGY